MSRFESWGRYPKVSQAGSTPAWIGDVSVGGEASVLAQGQGRSYGDVCLNDGGRVISTRSLDRFISFDPESGLLACEAGVTLGQILELVIPHGWFLPVSPGTKFVSVGGAVANDIHGKNHHKEGSFGRHVRELTLMRSDGREMRCSPLENADMFAATIGGLGLTGFIKFAVIALKKVSSAFIDMESIRFSNLGEFFAISRDSDRSFEYTVSWIDCLARGESAGRGIFMRGNHAPSSAGVPVPRKNTIAVPIELPSWTLNRITVTAFNFLYYHKNRNKISAERVHYDPFFYPLDSVLHWNRIYGRRGFLQFQCVVPPEAGSTVIREVLDCVSTAGTASFLAVLKEFGDIESPGLLSFPRKGVTLCLDFPVRGQGTFELFSRLERLVAEAGGALYPAKDAVMTGEHFKQFFPRWQEFSTFIDPNFSSSFWRRVL